MLNTEGVPHLLLTLVRKLTGACRCGRLIDFSQWGVYQLFKISNKEEITSVEQLKKGDGNI